MALSSDDPPGCSPGIRYEGSQQECRYQEGKEEEEEEDEEDISFTTSKAKKKKENTVQCREMEVPRGMPPQESNVQRPEELLLLSFFLLKCREIEEKRREEERTDGLDMGLNLLYCNTIAPREDV